MIDLEIQRTEIGINAFTMRAIVVPAIIAGLVSHTIASSGGTYRRVAIRTFQDPDPFSEFAIGFISPPNKTQSAYETGSRDARVSSW